MTNEPEKGICAAPSRDEGLTRRGLLKSGTLGAVAAIAAVNAAQAQSDNKVVLFGALIWDDNNAPVAKADVEVIDAASGRVLAKGNTDDRGRFRVELDLEKSDRPGVRQVFFIITDRRERLLDSKDLPTRLSGREVHVQLAVPHANRPDERERRRRPTVRVGAFNLDAAVFQKLEPKFVLELARAMVDPEFEKRIRGDLVALSPEIVPSEHARRRLSNTAILNLIDEIIRIKQWPRELRLKVDEILKRRRRDTNWPSRDPEPRWGFGELIHLCPNFRVTYYDSGADAVNPDTSAQDVLDPGNPMPTVLVSLPAGDPPTYIKRICFWLERALAAYISPPFSLRNPAAGGRVEVVVLNTDFGFVDAATGTVFIDNDLPPELLCAVLVHELFHTVHRLYGGSGPWRWGTNEGGAVWAEDSAAEFLNRYLDEAGTNFNGSGYMVRPHISLEEDLASPDPQYIPYKTSLFWRYIAEQHSPAINLVDEPKIGVEIFREILERCEAGSWSSDDIKTAIRTLPWYQDFYEFGYSDPAQQDLTSAETTMGNFALAAYLKDLGVNLPDRRFDFMEDEQNIYIDDVLAPILGSPLQTTLATVTRAGTGTVTASAMVSFSNNVPRFGSRYFEVTVDPGVTSVELQFTAGAGLSSVLFQAALIDEDNQVREIYRTDRGSYTKRFPNLRDGKRLNRVALVVTGCASAGSFMVDASPAAAASDVMVTRWHSVMKTEYEIDSRNWAWTWVSPDIFVDNDNDGVADGTVFFNFDNKLHIRLHNKGNDNAHDISVAFWYQDASGLLPPTGWLEVRDTANNVQSLSGKNLAAGASHTWSVDWSPVPSGMSEHFCVRAIVTVPGDPNTDNKRVLSNFGNVVMPSSGFVDARVSRRSIHRDWRREIELIVVPRFQHQFELAARDLHEQRFKTVKPGDVSVDVLRIYHRPVKGQIASAHLPSHAKGKEPCPCAAPLPQLAQKPDPGGDYPVDPRTLPPGVAGKPMVTLVHRAGGHAIGGVTLMLTPRDR